MSGSKYRNKVSSTTVTAVLEPTAEQLKPLSPVELQDGWSWNENGYLVNDAGSYVHDVNEARIRNTDQLVHPEVQSLSDCDTKYVERLTKVIAKYDQRAVKQGLVMLSDRLGRNSGDEDAEACARGLVALTEALEGENPEVSPSDERAVRDYGKRHRLIEVAPAQVITAERQLRRELAAEAAPLVDEWFRGLGDRAPKGEAGLTAAAKKHLAATQGATYAKKHAEVFAGILGGQVQAKRDARKAFNERNEKLRNARVADGREVETGVFYVDDELGTDED